MRRLLRAFAVLLAISLSAACGSSGSSTPATPADTTVLVYIVGSNLESVDGQATANLNQMMQVGSEAGKLNVVVQTGGAIKPAADTSSVKTEGIDWTHVQRYLVNNGSLTRLADLGAESVADPALNMGNAVTLENFLDWGVTNYPAKNFLVVLWDHGGGVNVGVGPDDVTSGSILSVPSITQALLTVAKARSVRFEIIGFDACLMATTEVASGLAGSSNYMVASEDLEPGTGWKWERFLAFVLAHPSAGGYAIGKDIADGFAEKQKNQKDSWTLSVIDLAKLPALSDATDAFVSQLGRYVDPDTVENPGWKAIVEARAASIDWGTSSAAHGHESDLVDAYDLVWNVLDRVNSEVGYDDALTGAATAVFLGIDDAVVYNVTSATNQGATGLTLFFPSDLSSYARSGYPANTSRNGVPFFAPLYTAEGGFATAYWAYSVANAATLSASVTMTPTPQHPFDAIVNNDYDNVLAAHQASACTYYASAATPPYAETQNTGPCYDAAQVITGERVATSKQWSVTFKYSDTWLGVGDSSGHAFPVQLLPNQYAATRPARLNSYLIPAWKQVAGSVPGTTRFVAGFLTVNEYYPVVPGPRALKVTSFLADAKVPGKPVPLANDTFAIGVYAPVGSGHAYVRTDNLVTAKDGELKFGTMTLSGGSFGYILTDLLGRESFSGLVPYVAPSAGP